MGTCGVIMHRLADRPECRAAVRVRTNTLLSMVPSEDRGEYSLSSIVQALTCVHERGHTSMPVVMKIRRFGPTRRNRARSG